LINVQVERNAPIRPAPAIAQPVAASGIVAKGTTRARIRSDVVAAATRCNLGPVLSIAARRIARCSTIDGCAGAHGKKQRAYARGVRLCSNYSARVLRYTQPSSRRAMSEFLFSLFFFLYTRFDVLCVAVHCSKVPAATRGHYAFFWDGEPARRVTSVE